MADRGLTYWLQWPHTRRDHVVAFAVFFLVTLAMGATKSYLAALFAGIVTLGLGGTLLAWTDEGGPEAQPEPPGDDEPPN